MNGVYNVTHVDEYILNYFSGDLFCLEKVVQLKCIQGWKESADG
jgi:hypothetical protein